MQILGNDGIMKLSFCKSFIRTGSDRTGVYVMFAKKAFRQNYIYKSNTYLRIFGAAVSIIVQISIWQALYNGKKTVNGVSLSDMMTYVIINLFLSAVTYSSIANRLAGKVRSGEIGIDFVKPVNLKYYLMAEDFGNALYRMIFTFLPTCIVSTFIVRFKLQPDLGHAFLFIISTLLGIVLMYYIHYILGLLSFWFKNSLYTNFLLSACFTLFGGSVVPLWFYPDALRAAAEAMPFRYVTFEPISIYLGKVNYKSALLILVMQLFWIILFMFVEKCIWNNAQKVVTVQGG